MWNKNQQKQHNRDEKHEAALVATHYPMPSIPFCFTAPENKEKKKDHNLSIHKNRNQIKIDVNA